MLTMRAQTILNLIVSDYIREATPVASDALLRRHDLGISSATIRNDIMELEQEGFLKRPHPSAGTVPLDKAYRLHVETIFIDGPIGLPFEVQLSIKRRLSAMEKDIDEWRDAAAAMLAGLVGNMAIATFPTAKESRVRHIELISLKDVLGLLIVVLEQAKVKRHLVKFEDPIDAADIQVLSNKLNSLLQGLSTREIEAKTMELTAPEENVVGTTIEILRDEEHSQHRDHFLAGLKNLLTQPEFADRDDVDAIIEGVEDGSLAQAVLTEAPAVESVVRVVIGQENNGDILWPLSVVLGRYGIPGELNGIIGAIGPVRMEYPRTIASVDLMTNLMTNLVQTVHPD
jgi:heat-inducible transcriptional repressor